ncbi:alpha-1,2-mannosyltransferase ALG9 [Topomyia yanbarensis]|uniref:alpha-1,2-mannosyltransferase ALG9 n=1 Tax=Topomyia yanbarensis TaxID=2498891 RepID=UPI00273AE631|nr:alpha-1,2-mannosyltransferase ALG9 [Topomyia yanbarensis]
MYLTVLFLSAWWNRKTKIAILSVVISTFIGWPFTALISLPFLYDVLVRRRMFKSFIFWSFFFTILIGIPLVLVDSYFYGRLTFAPINILVYNIFSSHGPNLFGIEPKYFYVINLFLNFNIAWCFALIYPLIIVVFKSIHYLKLCKSCLELEPFWKTSPLFIWLVVFTLQPHKEERFMFPVYPLLSLCGALCCSTIVKLFCHGQHLKHSFSFMYSRLISSLLSVFFLLFSLSRIFALYTYYHAPMELTEQLGSTLVEQNICIGKDWYRFPGSFFLPDNYQLRFIASSFDGILPAYYDETEKGSRIVHSYFNNLNIAHHHMLFEISKCDYLIDLDLDNEYIPDEIEPNYSANGQSWKIIKSIPFLDTNKSSKFFRSFYIPYANSRFIRFGNFNLLKRIMKL